MFYKFSIISNPKVNKRNTWQCGMPQLGVGESPVVGQWSIHQPCLGWRCQGRLHGEVSGGTGRMTTWWRCVRPWGTWLRWEQDRLQGRTVRSRASRESLMEGNTVCALTPQGSPSSWWVSSVCPRVLPPAPPGSHSFLLIAGAEPQESSREDSSRAGPAAQCGLGCAGPTLCSPQRLSISPTSDSLQRQDSKSPPGGNSLLLSSVRMEGGSSLWSDKSVLSLRQDPGVWGTTIPAPWS